MSRMVPGARPGWTQERVVKVLQREGVTAPVALLGVRGYYQDTMGAKGKNDVGIYDDAIFVVGPNGFASFNANTDPSRIGWNAKIKKPLAVLKAGLWTYMVGKHRGQYTALVQARPVTVIRDTGEKGFKRWEETGEFGINIHKGSRTTTSSEGCQTIWPDQWEAFIALVQSELKRADRKTLPYLLMEGQG